MTPSSRSAWGAAAAVGATYLAVRSGAAARLDGPAQRLLARDRGPATDRVVSILTDVGSVYALAGVAASLALDGRRALALEVAAAGSGAWVGAQGAKPLLRRPRPYELVDAARLVAVPAGSSWPSGHAALVAAVADTIGRRTGPGTRVVLALTTGLIGASRCYVGVHYPTDVVAGVGVGVLASRATRLARRWVRRG